MSGIAQARFAAALRDPTIEVAALLQGALTEANARERFAVHRNGFIAGLSDALVAAYPAIHRLLGDDYFRVLAATFVRERPPLSPVVHEYGADFADYLDAFAPLNHYPYVGDVARLEWALRLAYYAADAALLDVANLHRLADRDSVPLLLTASPGVRRIASAYPVHQLWQAQTFQAQHAAIRWVAEHVVVWRVGWQPVAEVLDPVESCLLAGILQRKPLAEIFSQAERLGDPLPSLIGLLQRGLIAAPTPSRTPSTNA